MKYKEIAQRLEEKIKNTQMSQKEIAAKMRISEDSVTRYIKGVNQPKITVLIELCEILHIDLNWLATGKGLEKEEADLLECYRSADNRGKRRILQTAELEADENKELSCRTTDKEVG